MATSDVVREPQLTIDQIGDELRATLAGRWTADQAPAVERCVADLLAAIGDERRIIFDLASVERLDTLGAWVLDRTRHDLGASGHSADFVGARSEHHILLNEVAYRGFQPNPVVKRSWLIDFLSEVGQAVVAAGKDFAAGISFLGEVVIAMVRVATRPRRFRGPSLVHHLELIAFRGVPIIALISFLVGCIVAQQGIFQLRKFGATPFVVDLVGILTLREVGVLLTAIMVAGRSGSSFTAEIGSMKMREEIDAMRTLGIDPMDTLVLPRVLALIVALPLLTFIGDITGLMGGGVMAIAVLGLDVSTYIDKLHETVTMQHFMAGMIKAPFAALIIGLVGCLEGMSVSGSAESLGKHVTSAVVKAIFLVIILDAVFAMFLSAIGM